MMAAAAGLVSRVLGWQLAFSLATGSLVSLVAPRLLLLSEQAANDSTRALAAALGVATLLGLGRSWMLLRRHRWVLRALALGSGSVEPAEMHDLESEPLRITSGWAAPSVAAMALLATPWRPAILDLTTGTSLALLGAVIVAAASLPLHVLVRATVMRSIELAPPDVMREVVESVESGGLPRRRVTRRLLFALVTPVAFVAIGSGLIAESQLRRADERSREETARALARTALEAGLGPIAEAGLSDAVRRARELGFSPRLRPTPGGYLVEQDENGVVEVTTPLDRGSASVRMNGSTVGVLGADSLLIALMAVGLAGGLGLLLGRAVSRDLFIATRGVRLLGTDAVLSGGTRVVHPARFGVVATLNLAIERLADRFRVFARAQERAIEAREAAARMRGLFFASVSHDLKSPLNAILGLTELVRSEALSSGQIESLDVIERRGRELLALIETILDAARVEAGQLSLVLDEIEIKELVGQSVAKGKDLGGDRVVEVVEEIAPGTPLLRVDRIRVGRALATFVGHAIRTAEQPPVRVRAGPTRDGVRIDVEVPSRRFGARQLEAMLDPSGRPSAEHRGLALGLSLARAVVELHHGSVGVEESATGTLFRVVLPAGV